MLLTVRFSPDRKKFGPDRTERQRPKGPKKDRKKVNTECMIKIVLEPVIKAHNIFDVK